MGKGFEPKKPDSTASAHKHNPAHHRHSSGEGALSVPGLLSGKRGGSKSQ